MRVVIVGASGFLGRAFAAAFAARGAELLCTARDPEGARAEAGWPQSRSAWIAADLMQVPPAAFWVAHLRPGDVVVNAAGVLREPRAGGFDAIHHRAPAQLFDACDAVGAALVIQVSALGAAVDAASAYHRSKGEADAHLRRCRTASVIVQPSLVWGEEGASARLFTALAVLPLLALPGGGRQALQPVHLDDVVDGVLALAEARPARSRTIAFVGPEPVRFADYLADLRRQLGYRHAARVLPLPEPLFRFGARLAGRSRASFLDAETGDMLLRGNAAPADEFAHWLGRAPRSHRGFVAPARAGAARRAAWLAILLPLVRLAVALVWIWTFVVSIGLYPRDQSLALLARVGAEGALATWLLNGAAVFDLALGIGTLALAPAWRARLLWPLQLALMAFYTAAISWAMPEFWLHPFGPLSKNLPMAAAIGLLWAMEPPARTRRTEMPRWNT